MSYQVIFVPVFLTKNKETNNNKKSNNIFSRDIFEDQHEQ